MAKVGQIYANLKCNTASFTTSMDKAKNDTRVAMALVKKEVTESNHSLALFGEAFGVNIPRHIRSFVSELPGVSRAMSVAFDGLVILVIIKVLAEAVEKVMKLKEAFSAVGEGGKKLSEGFEKINQPLENSNHQLELSIIKTENAIAKLQHKPQNLLAEALAEAAVKADELSVKLRGALEASSKLLKEQDHGYWMGLATNSSGTKQSQQINAWGAEQERGLQHDEHYDANVNKITEEMWRRRQLAIQSNNDAANSNIPHDTAHPYTGINPAIANKALYEGQVSDSNLHRGVDLTSKDSSEKNELKRDQEREAAQRTAAAAGKKAAAERMAALEQQLATEEAINGKTVQGEMKFWTVRLGFARKGSLEYLDIQKKLLPDYKAQGSETTKNLEEFHKTLEHIGNGFGIETPKTELKGLEDVTKNTLEWVRAAGEGVTINEHSAMAVAESSIRYQEATGRISANTAAMQLASLRAQQYTHDITDLQDRLKQITGDKNLRPDEKKLQTQSTQNRIDSLSGSLAVENMRGAGDADSRAARAGVRDFWLSVVTDSENAAASVKSVMTQAMNGVNAELVKGMTGQKTNWSSAFRGVGSSALNTGLKAGEGMIASSFGFGKLGTRLNPMITQDVNGLATPGGSAAVAGAGGWMGSLLKTFHIPGYAQGGDPIGLSIVGEKGPELANFGGGSHVTNNSDLRDMLKGGGGVTYSIGNIDARGTNAAEVDMRVRQGMILAHNQAVSSTIHAQKEMGRRKPSGSR